MSKNKLESQSEVFSSSSLPPHPRLFAKESDWEVIIRSLPDGPNHSAFHAAVFAKLEADANKLLEVEPLKRELEGRRLLPVSREALRRISTLAAVARLTQDDVYVSRALDELDAVAAFKDWNPSHFLDVAEMSLAVAIGYDWLYEYLGEERHARLEGALLTKGIEPSFEDVRGNWWIRSHNNWNQVCHAGLVVASVAIGDRHSEIADKVIRRAIRNIQYGAKAYAPAGVYAEGPIYWGYGTGFHVLLADALLQATGSVHGVVDYPGFIESGEYISQVTAPSGFYFNYSDSKNRRDVIPLFWIARYADRMDWLEADLEKIESSKPSDFEKVHRLFPMLLHWYPVKQDRATESKVDESKRWLGRGKNPIVVMRSSFDDDRALYVGMKGGSPSISHAHMDAGTFVLESDGIRWALDLGSQYYHTLETHGIRLSDFSQEAQRWSVFRVGPESHNIIRFNEAPQLVKGRGGFVFFEDQGSTPSAILNLDSIYDDHVQKMRRGMMVLNDRAVLFQDEWDSGRTSVDVIWQMLTEADVTETPTGWMLNRDGESLEVKILERSDAIFESVEVSLLLNAWDAPNEDVKRLRVKLPERTGKDWLRVMMIPGSSGDVSTPAFIPLEQWSTLPVGS